jgi:hypothetical protein
MQIAPFIIIALPRSRTAWLARFLTYGDWECQHETLRHMRSLDDVKSWLSLSCSGTSETAAAPWWRLLLKYRPDVRVVVIRRPVEQVIESLLNVDTHGAGTFDREILLRSIPRMDVKLDQIEHRMPNVMSVSYDQLKHEDVCARVFEYCLPYSHDSDWWHRMDPVKIECNMGSLMRYARAFQPQLMKLAATARLEMLTDLQMSPVVAPAGMTFQLESFAQWYRDGQDLFAEHLVQVDEPPYNAPTKNLDLMQSLDDAGAMQIVTARCNGRMFGYLMTVIRPSMESPFIKAAIQATFFASKECPGLGLKLQRAALQYLQQKEVNEVFFRAGPRGSGPKMGSMYRRLGAAEDGELFRLQLPPATEMRV